MCDSLELIFEENNAIKINNCDIFPSLWINNFKLTLKKMDIEQLKW